MEARIVGIITDEEAHINLSPTELRLRSLRAWHCCSPIIIADWMNFLGPTIIDIHLLQ
jgi:hypothetical protein